MKGNQGLDALAALCGGASKAGDESSSSGTPRLQATQQSSNTTSGNLSLQQLAMAMAQNNPVQDDSISKVNQNPSTSTTPPTSQFNATATPNLATLLGGNYGQAFPGSNTVDSANALQMAYLNILQSQASQIVPGVNSSSSVPYVDPTTMALLLSAQQRPSGKRQKEGTICS